jgi:hypothetical protein
VIDPERAAPLLAATDTWAMPGPALPPATLIQEALDEVDHVQRFMFVITETTTDFAPEATLTARGATLNVQAGGPACVIVTAFPATATVPVRAAPVFAVTEIVTVPDPDLPAVTEIHAAPDAVVHPHALVVVTLTFEDVAPWPRLRAANDTVNEQGGGPACVIVTGCPAMVTVPVRAAPVFAVTEIVTVPDPDLPAVTEIHAAPDAVVHPHALVVVTLTFEDVAPWTRLRAPGDTVNEQGGGPACVIVTSCPAMVTVPVRAAPVFAVTEIVTVPDPDLPAVTEIHAALDAVVHSHALVVVTLTLEDAAPWTRLRAPGDTVNEQGGGPACVIVTGCPAMVTVPVRAAPVFAVTEIVTVPDPDLPAVTEIHASLDAVVQPHSLVVVTARSDESAAAPKVTPLAGTVYVHGCCTGPGPTEPSVAATKFATVARLLLSARALSCDAMPVGMPLNVTSGLEK